MKFLLVFILAVSTCWVVYKIFTSASIDAFLTRLSSKPSADAIKAKKQAVDRDTENYRDYLERLERAAREERDRLEKLNKK